MIDGLVMPVIAARRWLRMEDRPDLGPLMTRGVAGGFVAFFSFGSIMGDPSGQSGRGRRAA